jgi:uncharacterized RDD family membrane protein YckC
LVGDILKRETYFGEALVELQKNEKQVTLKATCQTCAKPIGGELGSMTAWLFKDSRCTCPVTELVVSHVVAEAEVEVNSVLSEQVGLPERYKVLSLIGEGGMGRIYRVFDSEMQQTFAVKVLRDELTQDEGSIKRFEQEAAASAALTHANIVAVYGHGLTQQQHPYLLMDYLEGETLEQILKQEGHLEVSRALPIFSQVCAALDHAHKKGIVHRDIKPSNIMIARGAGGDNVKLVDFGIAKVRAGKDRDTQLLTQTGDVFGSPLYMSPEQCTGDQLDARSDIYSFGCVMYEVLTGKSPFEDANPIRTIFRHVNENAPLFSEKHSEIFKSLAIPESLERVVMHCLEKHPAMRYKNASELGRDLELFTAGKAVHARALPQQEGRVDMQPVKFSKRIGAAYVDGLVCGSIFWAILAAACISIQAIPPAELRSFFLLDLVRGVLVTSIAAIACEWLTAFSLPILLFLLLGGIFSSGLTIVGLGLEELLFFFVVNLVIIFYRVACVRSDWQATLGQKLFGLTVTDIHGYKPSCLSLGFAYIAKTLLPFEIFRLIRKAALLDKPWGQALCEVVQTPIYDQLSGCRLRNASSSKTSVISVLIGSFIVISVICGAIVNWVNPENIWHPKVTVQKLSGGDVASIITTKFWGFDGRLQNIESKQMRDGSEVIRGKHSIVTRSADKHTVVIEPLVNGHIAGKVTETFTNFKAGLPNDELRFAEFPDGFKKTEHFSGTAVRNAFLTSGDVYFVWAADTKDAHQCIELPSDPDLCFSIVSHGLYSSLTLRDVVQAEPTLDGFEPIFGNRYSLLIPNFSDSLFRCNRAFLGKQSFDKENIPTGLDRYGLSGISEKIYTTKGQRYLLTFEVAADPTHAPLKKKFIAAARPLSDASPWTKTTLQLDSTVAKHQFEFDTTGHTRDNPGWTTKSFEFTATGPVTTIQFESLDSPDSRWGALIDNIKLIPLPKTASDFVGASGASKK